MAYAESVVETLSETQMKTLVKIAGVYKIIEKYEDINRRFDELAKAIEKELGPNEEDSVEGPESKKGDGMI